jgi:hypothetical protein
MKDQEKTKVTTWLQKPIDIDQLAQIVARTLTST